MNLALGTSLVGYLQQDNRVTGIFLRLCDKNSLFWILSLRKYSLGVITTSGCAITLVSRSGYLPPLGIKRFPLDYLFVCIYNGMLAYV